MGSSLRPFQATTTVGTVKAPKPNDRLLRVFHLVKLLQTPDRTIRRQAELAILPGIKLGGVWRFWESEILEYLERNRAYNLLAKSR